MEKSTVTKKSSLDGGKLVASDGTQYRVIQNRSSGSKYPDTFSVFFDLVARLWR